MYNYLFFLGKHPSLSTAEIKAVFKAENIKFNIIKKTKKLLNIEVAQSLDSLKLMNRLGGTIKIAKKIEDKKGYIFDIVEFLNNSQPEGKIQFSISGIGKKDPLKIKKTLKEKGRSIRYIEIKNTASILHNNLIKKRGDLSVFEGSLFTTEAIQPIEELSKRDFGRPGADSFSGMLPPKLSRMMINFTQTNFKDKLLDAFCGSGTVLTEAVAMGYKNIYIIYAKFLAK